jgi:hypothetical protein
VGSLLRDLFPDRPYFPYPLIADLLAIPEQMKEVLDHAALVDVISRRYSNARDFLYLGRGINYPIALEGALKLKEISYIHAEGYPAGEMKHGPIALIDENLPVVVIAPRGSGYEKISDVPGRRDRATTGGERRGALGRLDPVREDAPQGGVSTR